ncbi:helix-turn-helix domain-containing protein [Kitasatospora sp. SolWspMP-SS2h]|uniref:helix-turn-helix domain-containing protein n=1 Tax=Kitasatospora sp. SolWspMP-SS2h TaxID=1305729 RepID=UPI000DB94D8C
MTADQRREVVARVAVEVFAREGFHAATTAAIAERAGVSQPYLFRLFATKRAVFLAAAELATDEAARAFTAAARDAGAAGAGAGAGAGEAGAAEAGTREAVGLAALRAGNPAGDMDRAGDAGGLAALWIGDTDGATDGEEAGQVGGARAATRDTDGAPDPGRLAALRAAAAGGAGGRAALRAGERAWRRMLGPGGPFALQWQLHAAAAGDPVVRAAAARHWGVLWRTVAAATGLPDPVLAAFFGRVLLRGAASALRPEPPADTTAATASASRLEPPPGTTAATAPRPEPPPDTAAVPPLPRPGPAASVTTPTAPTARGTRAAPVPAAVRPRSAVR